MKPLHAVALGLVLLALGPVDAPVGTFDPLPDPLGWVLVLVGLHGLGPALDPRRLGTLRFVGVLALCFSIAIVVPAVARWLETDPSLGWFADVPRFGFFALLCHEPEPGRPPGTLDGRRERLQHRRAGPALRAGRAAAGVRGRLDRGRYDGRGARPGRPDRSRRPLLRLRRAAVGGRPGARDARRHRLLTVAEAQPCRLASTRPASLGAAGRRVALVAGGGVGEVDVDVRLLAARALQGDERRGGAWSSTTRSSRPRRRWARRCRRCRRAGCRGRRRAR
ncbi:hypothetical protein G5V59_16995 [Nocardioides sp. W3-2-3]|uniref:hypothetical protein n=1 Tax=Nocardioides convexus TaxID=2712224 RepID=UPI0024187B4A|nr:hypothetical protein [Nocardioides convexus]NHA01006.1 hypothetical protein [Nocardioides convexus]